MCNIKFNMDPLESVSMLHYLGPTIDLNVINWVSLYQNMMKAQRRWGMVLGVLVKVGATLQARAVFYNSVVQVVLIYFG